MTSSAQTVEEKIIDSILNYSKAIQSTNEKEAIAQGQLAYELSDKYNFPRGRYKSLNHIGIVYLDRGSYDSSMVYFERAKAEIPYLKKEQENALADFHNYIGIIAYSKGDYLESINAFLITLQTYEQLKDTISSREILENIGTVYHQLKDFETSNLYYEKALALTEKKSNVAAHLLNSLGANAIDQKEFPKAFEYLSQAKEYMLNSEDVFFKFFNTRNFGYYHLMQDEAIEALPYFLESETLFAQISDHYLEANLYNNIGSCYVALSQYTKARVYLEKAVKMAQLSQESYLEAEAMVVLAELAAAEKPSKAYDLHLEATTLLDSLYEIEKVELSKRLIAEYEAEKKDKILAQQALEIQKRITRNRYVLSATIVLFLFSILLLVILYQRRKIKNQIEQNLMNEELKNKILKDDFLRLLGEYQLTNTQVIKIKNELRNELNENASGTVSSFYSRIRGNLIVNKNNPKLFDMNEVREDFILKLKAQYPSFTHFELLICFYSKLDLTGQEIAELTNKTLRSIESHQYRIRKKIRQSSTTVFN